VAGSAAFASVLPVTLQINLAPTDHPHAQHLLPHQLQALAEVCDDVLLVVDLHPSPGRFSLAWAERKPKLEALLDAMRRRHPRIRIDEVDHSETTRRRLGDRFLGGKEVPRKDSRGGPYHSYLFGLERARHRHVLHLDADILLGGEPAQWIGEALELMKARPEVWSTSPHPGPPREDDTLGFSARYGIVREHRHQLRFRQFSTRVFLLDLQRLPPLRRRFAPPIHVLRALRMGNPPFREPETLVTRAMQASDGCRVDFAGNAGAWTLHANTRTAAFYEALPGIVRRVEANAPPEAQRGRQDLDEGTLPAWREPTG